MAEKGFEIFFTQVKPILAAHFQDFALGLKSRLPVRCRESVPWAYILTDITSKYPIIKLPFHGFRNKE